MMLFASAGGAGMRLSRTGNGSVAEPWLTGEVEVVGVGCKGQIVIAPGVRERGRHSLDRDDGAGQFRNRSADAPVVRMGPSAARSRSPPARAPPASPATGTPAPSPPPAPRAGPATWIRTSPTAPRPPRTTSPSSRATSAGSPPGWPDGLLPGTRRTLVDGWRQTGPEGPACYAAAVAPDAAEPWHGSRQLLRQCRRRAAREPGKA